MVCLHPSTTVDSRSAKIKLLAIAPTTVHEREIVEHVDGFATQGKLSIESLAEIAQRLSFVANEAEADFLVKYFLWRLGEAKGAAT